MPITPQEVDAFLPRSLEDRRFSRGERQALGEFVSALGTETDRDEVRRRAFGVVRAAISGPDALLVFGWLEDVSKANCEIGQAAACPIEAESDFSPGEDCLRAVGRLFSNAKRTVDICDFTITDDRLANDAGRFRHHFKHPSRWPGGSTSPMVLWADRPTAKSPRRRTPSAQGPLPAGHEARPAPEVDRRHAPAR